MRRSATRRPFLAVLLSVISILLIICLLFLAAFVFSDANVRIYHPTEERVDVAAILKKESLTEEDYALLYRQTGLTKIGIDRAREHGAGGISRVRTIQKQYFTDWEIEHDGFAPLMCTDFLPGGRHAVNIYLENGDIILTSSTHFSAFRMGHAGIVTDATRGEVLQAEAYGDCSRVGTTDDFTDHAAFMILRPKTDDQTKAAAVSYAKEHLTNLPYNAFVGVFSSNESIRNTQCAHLVWYAYHAVGVELVENTNALILPYTLANSDELELVQVFGFDPDTLWDSLFH